MAQARKNGKRSKPPVLVGTAEAADILGVERPRIGRWLDKGKMPEPLTRLASGPVWDKRDIVAFKPEVEKRRRRRAAA